MTATAALKSPTPPLVLEQLVRLTTERAEEVQAWCNARRMESGAPFYSSVDLRHAGFKIAPVDTNLFPAGFNNLSPAARTRAAEHVAKRLTRYHEVKRILIIPENHTRNQGYLDNLAALRSVLTAAGCEVEIGSLVATDAPIELASSSGEAIREMPLARMGSMLKTGSGFCPQLIVLNNDLTSGLPEILRGVAQSIVPRPSQGWHRRRKSIHFAAYNKLAHEFATAFALDPWLLAAEFHQCGHVNFAEKTGLQCVAMGVEKVLHKIRGHYARYGITDEPYVYVKSDAGTYGMGIMTVKGGEELYDINKKIRNKMNTIKEGVQTTEVIIQEGVPTIDRVEGAPAEPMLYLIDAYAVGGAYRVNAERDGQGNLNAAGMKFVGMCDEGEEDRIKMPSCQFSAHGLVATLASLAAAREEYGESYSI
ncbi:MAG: glutamate--cysteine ligase [Rickettsiales bacterium]